MVRLRWIATIPLLVLPDVSVLPDAWAGEVDPTTLPNYPHGEFRADCRLCHDADSWAPAHISPDFDHGDFGQPLRGAHEGAPCLLCHLTLTFRESTGTVCVDCHTDVHLGEFGTECQDCHSTQSFANRPDARRDHRMTRFPLTGAHNNAECEACHNPGGGRSASYTNTPTDCYACHRLDYEAASNPDHLGGSFPTDCQDCHSDISWSGGTFNHDLTRFPLTGAHRTVECQACHEGFQFTSQPTDCYSCHEADYLAATQPSHDGFPLDCSSCHETSAWTGASFDHSATAFPLTGAHNTVSCQDCHAGGVYTGTPTDCYACHQGDYDGTSDPNHAAAGFPTGCTSCHGTASWSGASFDHNTTGFPLTGAHNTVSCLDCHVGGTFTGTSTDCYACHRSDYDATANPDHATAGFSTDCAACHDTVSWPDGSFDHAATSFPLTGAHNTVACVSCHAGNQFAGTASDCYSCHQTDYEGTTDPNHVAAGFPTDCTCCHGTASWSGASFDHNTTAFPLTGLHNTVQCLDCHVGEVFAGTPSDCYSCHQIVYDTTTDPDHGAAGFSTDCAACHGTSGWDGATFDHNTTAFPLTGAHNTVLCLDCHVGNVFAGMASDCYTCHQIDYEGTTDPNHVAAGFPTDCTSCHGTASWSGASFDHDTTAFPLTGAHNTVLCLDCHVGNVFAGTASDCYSCHQTDYEGTTDPNHVAAGFPTDCTSCHGTASWSGASFDHNTTAFPLTGLHNTVQCLDCHVGGVFAGTPSDCYSCHQTDYDGASDPNHQALMYPHDCTECHDTNGWGGATVTHGFPIYSGTHRQSRWQTCSTCHTSPQNYGVFSCFGCHPHSDKSGTDRDHSEVGGYQYDSAACYDCHPQG